MSEHERAKRELVEVCENRLILQLPKISEALVRLHRILTLGYMDAHMSAAIIELRAAANSLETIREEWPK